MSSTWPSLQALLATDPRDVGCERTWHLIDVYAETVLQGQDPEVRYAGITAHLSGCDPCAEDYRGLLEAMRHAAAARQSSDPD